MTWPTHAACGIASLWLLVPIPGALSPGMIGVLATIAIFGALLPDLDASESKIKSLKVGGIRPFAPLSALAYRDFGHRGFLHSPYALLLLGILLLLLAFLWGGALSASLWLGYASHLAADACTKSGIPSIRGTKDRWHLLPKPLRITTGAPIEQAVFAAAALLAIALLLTAYPFFSFRP